MPYVRRIWQNAPSPATPLNAAALNNIENGLEERVVFRNFDGTPVAPPAVVVITLTEDGTDIQDIAVYDSIDEVGA